MTCRSLPELASRASARAHTEAGSSWKLRVRARVGVRVRVRVRGKGIAQNNNSPHDEEWNHGYVHQQWMMGTGTPPSPPNTHTPAVVEVEAQVSE